MKKTVKVLKGNNLVAESPITLWDLTNTLTEDDYVKNAKECLLEDGLCTEEEIKQHKFIVE